jgi:hypothetical protein
MNSAVFFNDSRRSLLILIFFFLLLRIPLLDRPLQHDEVYKTSVYLNDAPFLRAPLFHKEDQVSWADDWRRQLAIHTPFVETFYYFWIKVFGDSLVSLRVPTILFGLAGLIAFYFFLILVFDGSLAFWVALLTAFSVSNIGYSTMAVSVIFESALLSASLLVLALALLGDNRKLLYVLFILNILGVLTFYHYFIYLFIQTLILWRNRKKMAVVSAYFITAGVAAMGALALIIQSYQRGLFGYDFWIENNVLALLSVMAFLPFNFPIEKLGTPMLSQLVGIFYFFVFALFCAGSVSAVNEFKKEKNTGNSIKIALLVVLLLPFICYLFTWIAGIKFGHSRNFFYLLPLYYVFVFLGLRCVIQNQKKRLLIKNILCSVFFMVSVATAVVFYSYKSIEKEMARFASDSGRGDFALLVTDDSFLYSYYSEKYGTTQNSFTVSADNFSRDGSADFLKEYFDKFPQAHSFIVISKPNEETVDLKKRYMIEGRAFGLAMDNIYEDRRVPFKIFDRFLKNYRAIRVSVFREMGNT